jgi:hypothetical protein
VTRAPHGKTETDRGLGCGVEEIHKFVRDNLEALELTCHLYVPLWYTTKPAAGLKRRLLPG